MEKSKIKETIKLKAVEIFCEKGFYGASIRDIAKAAECSLPMLYYYYNNKKDLFEEVACNEFIRLTDRLNSSVTLGGSLGDTYFQAVRQRKTLNFYDKGVYKLSMKVWLGFDGNREVRDKLMAWENGRQDRTMKILTRVCNDQEKLPVFSRIMVRIIENMIEKIVLLDEDIPDEDIRKEIDFMIETVAGR